MKFKLGPMALDLYKRYFSNQPYLMIQGPRLRISSEQNCETHKKRLDIYCQTCSIMICERCILTGTHKGHIGVDLELKIKELNSFISNGSMKETYIKIIEMEKASLLKKKNELKDLEKFIQDKEVVIKEIENRVEILQSYDTIDETNYINSFHFVTQVFKPFKTLNQFFDSNEFKKYDIGILDYKHVPKKVIQVWKNHPN